MDARKRKSGRELAKGAARALWKMGAVERKEGNLLKTWRLTRSRKNLAFARDWNCAELLEWAASRHRDREFIDYGEQSLSFEDINRSANRIARNLEKADISPGHGVAIMMGNHPKFLEVFFAIQKIGAYAVPINAALVGDGLAYVLNHSEVRAAVLDHDSAGKVAAARSGLERIEKCYVFTGEAPEGYELPEGMVDSDELDRSAAGDGENLGHHPRPDDLSLLMYTSGTTGMPKGVVTLYGNQRLKPLGLLAHMMYGRDDKLYTCLPLFHANALILTVMIALWVGIPVRISKRFSASRFWKEVGESGVTHFNTVGGMIPIMLKTPPSPYDRAHKVKRIVSAACPKDAWRPFEDRFGVQIWEGYGAIDGGGVTIMNMGNAPVGSLGRPARNIKYRLVDDAGNDVGAGEPGELIVYVGATKRSKVQYFKNEEASNEKVKDGWLRTGDLMQCDEKGFLYFVGRNTDSMRRRGENVSAYEVEKQVDGHPDVLESAAFGVPSEMGEDDIMICVVPVEGRTIDPKDLLGFLQERLPKYAVPSYLEVVEEFPKTETHRVKKNELKEKGVAPNTIKLEGLLAD